MQHAFISGFQFGMGLIVAICVAALIASAITGSPKDDSDGPNARSGVSVITDHKTGMQYLKSPGGGITPRMDTDGNQVRESR